MIRFEGYRPNPPGDYAERGLAVAADLPQYEGIIFTDGSVAVRWRTQYRSTSLFKDYSDFMHVHGHPDYGTRIVFLDGDDV